MKIGILSDTHGHVERVRHAVEILAGKGAKVLFHCGDLTTPEVAWACSKVPTYFVLGNNDHERDQIERAVRTSGGAFLGDAGIVELNGKTIAATHGHLQKDRAALLAKNPDFLFVGHSHHFGEWKEGTTRVLNPGALHRATKWTVALLDLETGAAEWLEILDVQK